eukprot:832887-Pelagomonas_calceolata.AAC.7
MEGTRSMAASPAMREGICKSKQLAMKDGHGIDESEEGHDSAGRLDMDCDSNRMENLEPENCMRRILGSWEWQSVLVVIQLLRVPVEPKNQIRRILGSWEQQSVMVVIQVVHPKGNSKACGDVSKNMMMPACEICKELQKPVDVKFLASKGLQKQARFRRSLWAAMLPLIASMALSKELLMPVGDKADKASIDGIK